VWKPPINGSLDEVRCEEGERDRHDKVNAWPKRYLKKFGIATSFMILVTGSVSSLWTGSFGLRVLGSIDPCLSRRRAKRGARERRERALASGSLRLAFSTKTNRVDSGQCRPRGMLG
jgi:hypothetical protein